ncbi:hypothetical protein LWF01_02745 [Saxibacter everestensis]|uniref:Uncharacterized protein n=1 Tax=Saxibacter everestensis TaxID=2909229 RepID=A0ABY8QWB3_9MICO|nr:hypothetical protein LWF01_02745 [Brevibacteriaceae bacterium ZFBP1038]
MPDSLILAFLVVATVAFLTVCTVVVIAAQGIYRRLDRHANAITQGKHLSSFQGDKDL